MIIATVWSSFASTLMCAVMAMIPGNNRLQSRIEMTSLVDRLFYDYGRAPVSFSFFSFSSLFLPLFFFFSSYFYSPSSGFAPFFSTLLSFSSMLVLSLSLPKLWFVF